MFRIYTEINNHSDDGVKVWVDKGDGYESAASKLSNHGSRYDYGSITLPGNIVIPIMIEWSKWGGHAILDLE